MAKIAKNRFLLLALFFGLTCAGAFAQANSNVTGIITDPTGAVVSEATITLTDPATGAVHTTVSDSAGLYNIAGLNAGQYNMKVTATGFETATRTAITVNISATFRVDVSLTVGSTSQTVTVAADALTVQTDSNVVSTLISQQQISELSTNGRNVISLATLGMGVSGNLPDMENPFSVNANYAISFNGLNQAHNIWIVDGGEAYDRGSGGKMSVMPSQDSLWQSSRYWPATMLPTMASLPAAPSLCRSRAAPRSSTAKPGSSIATTLWMRTTTSTTITASTRPKLNFAITSSAPISAVRSSSLTFTTTRRRRPSFSTTKNGAGWSTAYRPTRSRPCQRRMK